MNVLSLENISKTVGLKTLFENVSFGIDEKEKVGVIGANGSGKSTLLDMIVGKVKPDAGEIQLGETVVLGYYDQESRDLNPDQRVVDYIKETAEHLKTKDGGTISASQMLERFLFSPEAQYAPIGKLSGGEKRRLYLLKVLMSAPNVLLLDEPTNDLDIPTLSVLEDYLDSFVGCLVVVSHDRYFLDRTVEHLFRFEKDGELKHYTGGYSDFLDSKEREEKEASTKETMKKSAAKPNEIKAQETGGARKLTSKERKELEKLEAEIAKSEARKTELAEKLSQLAADYEKSKPIYAELESLEKKLETDMTRWAELAEWA